MKMLSAILIALVVILIGFGVWFVISGLQPIFEANSIPVKELPVSTKPYNLKIVYVPGNATLQDNIQVRKVYNNNEDVIQFFDRYDFLVAHEVIGDSVLQLMLKDTSLAKLEVETFYVKLP